MIDAMPRPHLPHLQREKTRHGKVIYYVRLNRETPRVRINGPYGSDQFMTEYRAAIAGEPVQTAKIRVSKASLQWLADQWRESSDWFMKATATKRQRENILANILSENGRLPYAEVTTADLIAGRERRMKTPFAANNFLKTMKALFAWAKEGNYILDSR